jgi:hypothetical protein
MEDDLSSHLSNAFSYIKSLKVQLPQMEGLAAAGGIAIVGLAGQVAEGCAYLLEVLDDARNAPDKLILLGHELRIIEQIVRSAVAGKAGPGLARFLQRGHHEPESDCPELRRI